MGIAYNPIASDRAEFGIPIVIGAKGDSNPQESQTPDSDSSQ